MLIEERRQLLELPADRYPCEERCEVSISKYPYARFDLNDYSVPSNLVQRTLVVLASLDTVRILDGSTVVATHPRCYDRGQPVEDKAHIEELREFKAAAAQHGSTNLLAQAVPSSIRLLAQVAERGLPLGRATRQLMELLHAYGAGALEAATCEALEHGVPDPHAVLQVLERRRRDAGKAPPLPVPLPDDPRVRNIVLKPRGLHRYSKLHKTEDDHE